ncbi:15732_t:CDS:2 [Cetraspora pellucida]|uniref:15732_t:CDS:1 n=1 Tax=Cetraspora pellucida TaxID=1433469 RepID=A0A9N9BGT6_9GLOM|nr:15732_t:CDS:2 [Cetraspora pellucida]
MDPFKIYLFLCLLIFLVWTSAGVDVFAPVGRFRQSSALVGNKLYVFGSAIYSQTRETIILDVTLSTLNTSNPSWSLPNASVPTNSAFASACVGGPNKNTIFLLEHLDTNNNVTNTTVVYSFDTVSSTWSPTPVSGVAPESRQQFQASSSPSGVLLNDIFMLDTSSLVWTQGSLIGAPTGRVEFSATLLNNGRILYIGGDGINMANIPFYNTNSGKWSSTVAVGDTIDTRSSHTAVLSPDGHVIIYGGNNNNSALDQSQQLASLDTTVNPYTWSKKSLNGPSVTQIQTVIASNSLSTDVIVAIPIVSIAILAIIGFTGYFLYKKNKQNDVIRIAGSKYGY